MRKIVFTGLVLGAAMILPASMAGAQDAAAGGGMNYPPCSRGVTDKCIQTHEGMGGGMGGDHAMHHGHWGKHHHHHGSKHHHWARHHRHGAKHHRHHAKHHDNDAKQDDKK